jgi:hypothetical protein
MAHFAKLDENNNVLAVHVVNNNVLLVNGIESEQAGIDFLTELHNHPLWKQTSYNGNFRKQYCGVGYSYNAEADVFVASQPFSSWTLDNNFDWQAPTPHPTDGKPYTWSEDELTWKEVVND